MRRRGRRRRGIVGGVLPGRRVNGERYIHGEIYKARPDVMSVIHSHSQAVIPLGLTAIKMKPVIAQAAFCSAYVRFGMTSPSPSLTMQMSYMHSFKEEFLIISLVGFLCTLCTPFNVYLMYL